MRNLPLHRQEPDYHSGGSLAGTLLLHTLQFVDVISFILRLLSACILCTLVFFYRMYCTLLFACLSTAAFGEVFRGALLKAMITHRLGVFYLPLVAGRRLVIVIPALCIAQEVRGANGGRQLERQFYSGL